MPRSASLLKLYLIGPLKRGFCSAWDRLNTPSGNPANAHRAVLVRAIEPGNSRLLDHHPAHAVFVFQPQKIFCSETLPRSLRLHLRPPFLGQRRKHADHAVVLDSVGQVAALRETTKSDLISAGNA